MFSLARTIDFVMNENMSGLPHKYSSVVYKATAPDIDNRYNEISEMYTDLVAICNRPEYESPEEIALKLVDQYKKSNYLDVVQLLNLLNEDVEGRLTWNLVIELGNQMSMPFIKIIDLSFEIALREIRRVSDVMQENYHQWKEYDRVAYWAIRIINERKTGNDEINIEAAKIIDYVASSVNRYDIKKACNRIKTNTSIDGHVRAQLTYYNGY